jgi:hypothetical protein
MVRQILSSACSHIRPSVAPSPSVDLWQFAVEAWCVHLDLIPCEWLLYIPEQDVVVDRGPPLFLRPEEVIHSCQLALWYRVFIDVIEVED